MDITGIGAVADLATTVVSKIWPDKSAQEQQQLAASLALIQGQMAINQTEAASPDPLQHWRGGLGWVCVAAFLYSFVLRPMIADVCIAFGHSIALTVLDTGSLMSLTLGMLGLGGLHATERIKGVK